MTKPKRYQELVTCLHELGHTPTYSRRKDWLDIDPRCFRIRASPKGRLFYLLHATHQMGFSAEQPFGAITLKGLRQALPDILRAVQILPPDAALLTVGLSRTLRRYNMVDTQRRPEPILMMQWTTSCGELFYSPPLARVVAHRRLGSYCGISVNCPVHSLDQARQFLHGHGVVQAWADDFKTWVSTLPQNLTVDTLTYTGTWYLQDDQGTIQLGVSTRQERGIRLTLKDGDVEFITEERDDASISADLYAWKQWALADGQAYLKRIPAIATLQPPPIHEETHQPGMNSDLDLV